MAAIRNIGINHVQVMVKGMHELAKSDGLHDAERVMLRDFYTSCRDETGALADFDDLIRRPFDAKEAADVLNTSELRRLFLQSCVLLAYADGKYSAGERKKIAEYGKALGTPAAELAELEALVGDQLLQQVSKIENVDALREVAKEIRST
jgi:hypothetical protein